MTPTNQHPRASPARNLAAAVADEMEKTMTNMEIAQWLKEHGYTHVDLTIPGMADLVVQQWEGTPEIIEARKELAK